MRRRSYGEQVKNRVFAESVPARFKKSCFRFPAMREQGRMTVEHPPEISALVDCGCQAHDFLIMGELLTRRQHARQKQRRVYGRHFTLPTSGAALGIQPMVKPAMILLSTISKEPERGPHPLFGLIVGNPFPFGSYAKRRQAKSGRGNARHLAMVLVQWRVVGPCAVGNETSPGIRLLPKVLKLAALHVFKKYFVRC